MSACSMEDYDVDEEDEEALIEQRRLQRLAIVQVSFFFWLYNWLYFFLLLLSKYKSMQLNFSSSAKQLSLFALYRNTGTEMMRTVSQSPAVLRVAPTAAHPLRMMFSSELQLM